jgi:hypothetical protein
MLGVRYGAKYVVVVSKGLESDKNETRKAASCAL